MRLGAAVFGCFDTAEAWAERVLEKGYRAVFCPVDCTASPAVVRAYKEVCAHHDIVIGEVGVWNNVLHPDAATRRQAVEYAKGQLALAEAIGARCCVNIAGTHNPHIWYGPHPQNFTEDTMEQVVGAVRDIIDSVRPKHTCYTLEPSPWLYPDGIETTLELLRRVDRPAFGVHWDPVNMMSTPRRYYQNGEYLKACMAAFGPHIKSVHLKDIYMDETFTLFMQERPAGQGILDYDTLIQGLDALDVNMPGLVEHLESEAEVDAAVTYVRAKMETAQKGC